MSRRDALAVEQSRPCPWPCLPAGCGWRSMLRAAVPHHSRGCDVNDGDSGGLMRRTLVGLLVAAGTAVPVLAALTPDGAALVLFAVIAAVAAGLAACLGLPAQALVPAEHAGSPGHIKKRLHIHDVLVQHHQRVNVGDLPADNGNPGGAHQHGGKFPAASRLGRRGNSHGQRGLRVIAGDAIGAPLTTSPALNGHLRSTRSHG